MFDDLDADSIWSENRQRSGLTTPAIEAIDRFLTALRDIDESDTRSVVASSAWASAKDAAQAVVASIG